MMVFVHRIMEIFRFGDSVSLSSSCAASSENSQSSLAWSSSRRGVFEDEADSHLLSIGKMKPNSLAG
jgi:hypothetical protein